MNAKQALHIGCCILTPPSRRGLAKTIASGLLELRFVTEASLGRRKGEANGSTLQAASLAPGETPDRSVWKDTTPSMINDVYGDRFHPFGEDGKVHSRKSASSFATTRQQTNQTHT